MKKLFTLVLLLTTTPVAAQNVPGRIARSLALRDQWQWLTRDIASPAEWDADGRHFHYRKTVEGGFAFVDVDVATRAKSPAFDAAALAPAIAKVMGEAITPLRLPFEHFSYTPDRSAIRLSIGYDDTVYRCTLVQPVCAVIPPDNPSRPRGFGVVRDLRVPADNHPRPSPDGKLEALILDDNLVVRAANGGQEIWRSQDGSPANFYDPETIAWSPDGRHIALQRVRPGWTLPGGAARTRVTMRA